MPPLNPDDLRRYAARDWQAPERMARQQPARLPLADKIRIAIEPYEAARRTRPEWPEEATRRAELAAH